MSIKNKSNIIFKAKERLSGRDKTTRIIKKALTYAAGIIYRYCNHAKGYYCVKVKRNPYDLLWVAPSAIEYSVDVYFAEHIHIRRFLGFKVRNIGVVDGGNWDTRGPKFSDFACFKAFQERFIENRPWKSTAYYDHFLELQGRKLARFATRSFAEFEADDLRKWEEVYHSIREDGYKTQNSLGRADDQEVQVAVNRDGEVLFVDGRHRLSIAKLLGIKEIPVIVAIWHKKYVDSLSDRSIRKARTFNRS